MASSSSASASAASSAASKLELDVNEYCSRLSNAFNQLIHPNNTLIGYTIIAENEPNEDNENTTAMNDTTNTNNNNNPSSLAAAPITDLPYSTVQSIELKQNYQSSVYTANLIDSTERLLSICSQLKLSKLLNDRGTAVRSQQRIELMREQLNKEKIELNQLLQQSNISMNELEHQYHYINPIIITNNNPTATDSLSTSNNHQ